jgi:hypothetical protein
MVFLYSIRSVVDVKNCVGACGMEYLLWGEGWLETGDFVGWNYAVADYRVRHTPLPQGRAVTTGLKPVYDPTTHRILHEN